VSRGRGEAGVVVAELRIVGDQPFDDRVVELQEREVQLRDDEVLVVARVADAGPAGGRHPREVVAGHGDLVGEGDGGERAEPEGDAVVGHLVIDVRNARAVAVHRVEVQCGLAEVAQGAGHQGRLDRRQRVADDRDDVVAVGVRGDVVVDELTPVRVHGRDRGVGLAVRRRVHHRGTEGLEPGHDRARRLDRQVRRGYSSFRLAEQVAERRRDLLQRRRRGLLDHGVEGAASAVRAAPAGVSGG
jgi:hypothetical protein